MLVEAEEWAAFQAARLASMSENRAEQVDLFTVHWVVEPPRQPHKVLNWDSMKVCTWASRVASLGGRHCLKSSLEQKCFMHMNSRSIWSIWWRLWCPELWEDWEDWELCSAASGWQPFMQECRVDFTAELIVGAWLWSTSIKSPEAHFLWSRGLESL